MAYSCSYDKIKIKERLSTDNKENIKRFERNWEETSD